MLGHLADRVAGRLRAKHARRSHRHASGCASPACVRSPARTPGGTRSSTTLTLTEIAERIWSTRALEDHPTETQISLLAISVSQPRRSAGAATRAADCCQTTRRPGSPARLGAMGRGPLDRLRCASASAAPQSATRTAMLSERYSVPGRVPRARRARAVIAANPSGKSRHLNAESRIRDSSRGCGRIRSGRGHRTGDQELDVGAATGVPGVRLRHAMRFHPPRSPGSRRTSRSRRGRSCCSTNSSGCVPTTAPGPALEYACHVRDVLRLGSYRVRLMLEDDNPQFENWDQDATAISDAYELQDPSVVAGEISTAGAELAGEYATVRADQWSRSGLRSDGCALHGRVVRPVLLARSGAPRDGRAPWLRRAGVTRGATG